MKRSSTSVLLLASLAVLVSATFAQQKATPAYDTKEYKIRVTTVADGLSYPYCLAFLPDGNILVTEMNGKLRLIRNGVLTSDPIGGIPMVLPDAPSHGLMDIALHPNYAKNHLIYFSYNKPGEKGVTEAVARGTFDGKQLTGVKDIFVADAWSKTKGRQNSRIAFGRDGMLYMTVSVGGEILRAQDMKDHAGKVLRLRDDGSVPPDNPYVGKDGYRPEIFTNGHGNIHGLAIRPETGEAWNMATRQTWPAATTVGRMLSRARARALRNSLCLPDSNSRPHTCRGTRSGGSPGFFSTRATNFQNGKAICSSERSTTSRFIAWHSQRTVPRFTRICSR